ncbi:hypothetical protein DL766_008866 [Monosporascus sp. MC13-8B]|nr:hypothetical protein DL766_008866 [Monosporascus sp. MC13-8B]
MATTMRAIKMLGKKKATIQEVPLPNLRNDNILCKVNQTAALNSTDWKHIDSLGPVGTAAGRDFVGIVEEVGPKVKRNCNKATGSQLSSMDAMPLEPEDSCFAEYAVAKGDFQMKIPDNLNDDQAATMGVGITTVGQGLYQTLGLPLSGRGKAGVPLLVSGCEVLTTWSPRNFPFVENLGASKALNYKDPQCGKTSAARQSPRGGGGGPPKINSLLPVTHSRDDVESHSTLAYTVTGETFNMGDAVVPAKPEDLEFDAM